MGADPASDNDPDHRDHNRELNRDDSDTPILGIPSPSPASGDTARHRVKVPPHQQVWRYDQRGKGRRGKHRRYSGQVEPIGGSEGERIRRELAAIIYDLLDWAKQQTDTPATETQSRLDGGADDNPA